MEKMMNEFLKNMMALSDADFLRGLKTEGFDNIIKVRNDRLENIAKRIESLEKVDSVHLTKSQQKAMDQAVKKIFKILD